VEGIKGMLPLGCLPLWGREGVSLIPFLKEWRGTGSHQKKYIILFPVFPEIKPALHKNYSKNSRGKNSLF
jgi:hypothetical protein